MSSDEASDQPFSAFADSVAEALFSFFEEERLQGAQAYGLPEDSTFEQVIAEARRQTVLNRQEIISHWQSIAPSFATTLVACHGDQIPLLQHPLDSPEDPIARIAAATFIVDYRMLHAEERISYLQYTKYHLSQTWYNSLPLTQVPRLQMYGLPTAIMPDGKTE